MFSMFKSRPEWGLNFFLICISAIGPALLFLATQPHGVGTTPDSYHYVTTAHNLAMGKGFVSGYGSPYVAWPPLFPLILSIFSYLGLPMLKTTLVFNIIVFFLIVYSSSVLFRQSISSPLIVVVATLTVSLSSPLINTMNMVWTEPLFTLLLILSAISLKKLSEEQTYTSVVNLGVLIALLSLQRYIGVVAWGWALLILFFDLASFREKCVKAGLLSLISLLPLSFWVIRNIIVAGVATGPRKEAVLDIYHYLIYTPDVFASWILSPTAPLPLRLTFIITLTVLVCGSIYKMKNRPEKPSEIKMVIQWGLLIVLYTMAIITLSSITQLDTYPSRYLAPLYPFFIGILMSLCALFLNFLKTKTSHGSFAIISISFIIAWFIQPVLFMNLNLARISKEGPGVYTSLIKNLSGIQLINNSSRLKKKTVFSNAPEALYFSTGIDARLLPSKFENAVILTESAKNSETYIVRCHFKKWGNYLTNIQLSRFMELKEVYTSHPVSIYKINPSDQIRK